jgi:hypothetical protein
MTFESKVPPFVRLLFPSGNALECVQSVHGISHDACGDCVSFLFPQSNFMNAKSGYSPLRGTSNARGCALCNLRVLNQTQVAN